MDKLKPCPFCGKIPILFENKFDLKNVLYGYYCSGDEFHSCEIGYFKTPEQAKEAWNRRANDG